MQFVGLYREAECSPGVHRSNDALLLDRVATVLRSRGCAVEVRTLTANGHAARHPEGVVFSMCQGRVALDILARWEDEGVHIVNAPRAALNTYREHLPRLMAAAGIPFPATTLIATSKGADQGVEVNGGFWLKRGDMHASVSADVQWVDSPERLRAGLKEFAGRGITRAALQRHAEGDEIKFYGVAGRRFFHWFYSKRANDGIAAARHPLDPAALEQLASRAAAAAGLAIYGGDVIVSPSGALTLIDLNDWPSFAPCRNEAADAIAGYLMGHPNVAWHPGRAVRPNTSAL
jgi:glutathione synthase/RimK-type ligase-like ATP-grasp enzyme